VAGDLMAFTKLAKALLFSFITIVDAVDVDDSIFYLSIKAKIDYQ
jgi:hypothetical protein